VRKLGSLSAEDKTALGSVTGQSFGLVVTFFLEGEAGEAHAEPRLLRSAGRQEPCPHS
jgi:hypothetical protein